MELDSMGSGRRHYSEVAFEALNLMKLPYWLESVCLLFF